MSLLKSVFIFKQVNLLQRFFVGFDLFDKCAATQECHAANTGHDTLPCHSIQTQDMTPYPVTV